MPATPPDPSPRLAPIPHTTGLPAPPKPPLAFRVGVVGHRPDRLNKADLLVLEGVLRCILQAVETEVQAVADECAGLFAPVPPQLRAVSPLAEGTDRIFASRALDLGWHLCCVMPFPQAEFENDFASGEALEPDSLTRFRALLERAKQAGRLTRFALDGSRADASSAYGAGGQVVLNQSDLLVVVWDGERLGKRGGTEETFAEAQRRGVPVVWVDAQAPHPWQLLRPGHHVPDAKPNQRSVPDGLGTESGIRNMVRDVIAVPRPGNDLDTQEAKEPQRSLERFYAERRPKWSIAIVGKIFQGIVADGKWPSVTLRVQEFEEAVKKEWPRDRSTPVAEIVDTLRPFYAWPDKLAVLYSDCYRSAFILAFLLAAVAVGMALLPVGLRLPTTSAGETVSTATELAAIIFISILVLRGRWKAWHERWIDYRLAAELVRHLRLVAPAGGERPFAQVPAHLATYGQPGATWMDWYLRAVARFVGLPNVTADRAHLQSCLVHLQELLTRQIAFHEANGRRCQAIESRIHRTVLVLLGLTLVACVVHLLHLLPSGEALASVCAFFPALGAALAGINNQGEYRRLARRSAAMQTHLRPLLERVRKLEQQVTTAVPGSVSLAPKMSALVSDSARLLVAEVLDWRVVFLDRPLHPPA